MERRSDKRRSDDNNGLNISISSEPEQIGRLHKKLAAIINVAARSCKDVSRDRVDSQVSFQVAKVAVIADKDRGARMHKVGNKEVGVEVLGGRERTDRGIREHRVVLQDDAGG